MLLILRTGRIDRSILNERDHPTYATPSHKDQKFPNIISTVGTSHKRPPLVILRDHFLRLWCLDFFTLRAEVSLLHGFLAFTKSFTSLVSR